MEAASCTDAEFSRPVTRAFSRRGQHSNVRVDRPGLGFRAHIPSLHQSTDTTVIEPATGSDKPCPLSAGRPTHARHQPAQYVQQVQAQLTNPACVRSTTCRPACSHAATAICLLESETDTRARCCCCVAEDCSVASGLIEAITTCLEAGYSDRRRIAPIPSLSQGRDGIYLLVGVVIRCPRCRRRPLM